MHKGMKEIFFVFLHAKNMKTFVVVLPFLYTSSSCVRSSVILQVMNFVGGVANDTSYLRVWRKRGAVDF